jgi:hypothetical protein
VLRRRIVAAIAGISDDALNGVAGQFLRGRDDGR